MRRWEITLVSVVCLQLMLTGCGGNGGGGSSTQTYTIGGTASGLAAGTKILLMDNGTNELFITADGSFTFSKPIPSGSTYQVMIQAEPGTQLCLVTSGSGTAFADVTSVEVSCSIPSQQVLYSFGSSPDGKTPSSNLVFDSAGNLYGTTSQGGDYGYGAVFELTPNQGPWTETVLYSFCAQISECPDGAAPNSNLLIDAAGNLYGTTVSGGAYARPLGASSGVVFELTRQSGSTWSETVLHSFGGSGDGGSPSGVALDGKGNLYGTTSAGGIIYGPVCPDGCGIVFELSLGNGQWTEQVLYSFCSQDQCADGGQPFGGVAIDSSGNLYGTTALGGTSLAPGDGTVFELTPNGSGQWTQKALYKFQDSSLDGQHPVAGVVLDPAGNVYGTTEFGYATTEEGNNGVVFMLTRGTGGNWTETVIFAFCTDLDCAAGGGPVSALAIDKGGNLYGTTTSYGLNLSGATFALVPTPIGMWSPVTLYDYGSASALIFDNNGNLYGTGGIGANRLGDVFEITP
jgi:uncharacterized repeat protein (TIGR03803 family)